MIVRVPDRGTLVLGGLSTTTDTTSQGGVPILTSIPLLKRLFTNSSLVKTRHHVVFLVTPTILIQSELEP